MDATPSHGGAQPVQVFLLDDHDVVRQGVRALLEAQPDLEVVGEAENCAQALARIPALRPQVAVLDVRLPDGDGIGVCRELHSRMPELACLMLTSFDDDDALLDAVMAGAAGYVLKEIKGNDLVTAVRTVAAGQSMLDPATTHRLMEGLRHQDDDRPDDALGRLTEREQQILVLISKGRTNRQIGEELYLAEKTVKNHVSRILSKLGVERRLEAAMLASHSDPVHRPHSR